MSFSAMFVLPIFLIVAFSLIMATVKILRHMNELSSLLWGGFRELKVLAWCC
jgi:hypothetical protein